MWMRAIVILLVASALHAQEVMKKNRQEPCPEERAVPAGPGVAVKERHNLLRRDREEDFAVVLCSPQLRSGGCAADPDPSQTGVVPLSLGLDAPQDLRVRYRDGLRYRPLVPGTPVRFHHGTKVLLLKIRARDTALLGVQSLHGNLMFETMGPGKAVVTQQLPVDFQVTVAAHGAKAADSDWRFGSQVGRHMKDVALAPLVPFEFLMLLIACSSGCDL